MSIRYDGTAIDLVDCAKTFPDGTKALTPTTLRIDAGETIVLLGPSGCGKTTMLRIIAGLESPDSGGAVLFDDEDLTPLPIEQRNVGMVFQSYALFPNMNVLDNVAYGLKIRRIGRTDREAQAGEVLEMMRIQELAGRRIDQLSGGQRQRVALARALAARPRVLLLDEPLTALDAALRDTLRSEIDRLLRQLGITAIYVTHDQQEAMVLGDRVVVMSKGRVAQIGTPQEIYHNPGSRFVGEFVGTMNRIEGQLGETGITTAAGRLDLADMQDRPNSNSETIEVFFRPEAATLCEPGPQVLTCRVETVHFHGANQRVFLHTGAGPEVIVDLPSTQVYRPGDDVGLRIAPDGITFF